MGTIHSSTLQQNTQKSTFNEIVQNIAGKNTY